ncbi:MAG: S9 family peptidase [Dehalococcoidia bacterium]|nr:S9 family peptidase [Dehalococcoidia bacterium]
MFKMVFKAPKLLLLIAIVMLVVMFATPQGRSALKTLGFVFQVIPSIPVKPIEIFSSQPVREEVRFTQSTGSGVADIYRPDNDKENAAVLLFLGVNPAGRDDARVVNLAESLARTGMVVMIPWSDTMTQNRIDPNEVSNLVEAYKYLSDLEYVDPERVGFGGFCVGSSLAAVAAQDPEIRDNIAFINFFGGYFDAMDLMASISSSTRFGDYGRQPWEPSDLATSVLRGHLIELIPLERDKSLIEQILSSQDSLTKNQVGDLSEEGKRVYKLLTGTSLVEARELISQLPEEFQDDMKAVSPISNVGDIKARILIMHDASDNNVPPEESRRFFEALKGREDVTYTEFAFFNHMDPGRDVGPLTWMGDVYKLFMHLYSIIRIT